MEYTVELFKFTGFNQNNIPDSVQILDEITGEHKTYVPSVFINQNGYLATIRVQGQWGGLRNIDYCRIKSIDEENYDKANFSDYYCYFVTNVFMHNDEVGELTLELDAITTVGLKRMQFIDGWCVRRIIPQKEQSLENYQANIIGESWNPTNPMIVSSESNLIKTSQSILGVYNEGNQNIVITTTDITNITNFAESYVTQTEAALEVAVPKLPVLPNEMYTEIDMVTGYHGYKYTFPNGAFFSTNVDSVNEGIQSVRLLGVESSIIGSYSVPLMYCQGQQHTTTGHIKNIINRLGSYRSNESYIYADNVENLKVFALYNTYEIVSIAANNSAQYTFQDIYHKGDTAPLFKYWADVSPSGTPFIRPEYYHENNTDEWFGAIKGSNWLNNQIVFQTGSGIIQKLSNANYSMRRGFLKDTVAYGNETIPTAGQTANNLIKTVNTDTNAAFVASGIGSSGVGALGGIAMAAQQLPLLINSFIKNGLKYTDDLRSINMEASMAPPTIVFPYSTSIQSFVGNDFNLYHYKLSENDVRRFDNYLHRYGESVDEPFKTQFLTSKQKYNYIQTTEIVIRTDYGKEISEMCQNAFNRGVRIWHTLPTQEALQIGGNPDV